MSDAGNQWSLFGFDTRHIAQAWIGAWRDLLFAPSSPLRRRLDEPVRLESDGLPAQFYQGGMPLPSLRSGDDRGCRALLLPEALALTRRLSIPLLAEAELPAVLAMEIRASSPFAADDTVSGWCEDSRDAQGVHIVLAIASRGAVHGWLRERGEVASGRDLPEVWVPDGEARVVVQGFGEGRRDRAYRRRLWRCAGLGAALLVLLLFIGGLFSLHQQRLLQHREQQYATLRDRAASVMEARASLAAANETIARFEDLAGAFPSPHLELARLTRMLKDDVFLAHFSLRGSELRVRGQAEDAALVMQTVAEEPAYERVTAPQAIRPVGSSGREQFYLNIELRGRMPEDGA